MSSTGSKTQVILWDIDGTLVNSRASREDKHVRAVEVFLGKNLPIQNRILGKTDRQIITELLEATGCEFSLDVLNTVISILEELTLMELSLYPVKSNPGVTDALKATRDEGWTNGLLTGNTPIRAHAKLESAGIAAHFDSRYFYCGHESMSRYKLVGTTAAAVHILGCSSIILIGDTPLDILSAQTYGIDVVAVASGSFDTAALREYNPNLMIEDLESGMPALLAHLRLTGQ